MFVSQKKVYAAMSLRTDVRKPDTLEVYRGVEAQKEHVVWSISQDANTLCLQDLAHVSTLNHLTPAYLSEDVQELQQNVTRSTLKRIDFLKVKGGAMPICDDSGRFNTPNVKGPLEAKDTRGETTQQAASARQRANLMATLKAD